MGWWLLESWPAETILACAGDPLLHGALKTPRPRRQEAGPGEGFVGSRSGDPGGQQATTPDSESNGGDLKRGITLVRP